MSGIFNADGPIFRVLARIADLIILSILWTVTSVPVFTIGISTASLHYSIHKAILQDRGTISGEYFRSFKTNFRQATLSFLVLGAAEGVLIAECFITRYLQEQGSPIGKLWIVFLLLSVCTAVWIVYAAAYSARFEDPVKKTVLQAGAIALAHFDKNIPLTIGLVASIAIVRFFPPVIILVPGLYGRLACPVIEKIFAEFIPEVDTDHE